MFNSKDIIVLVLLFIVVYFLTLIMIGRFMGQPMNNVNASKELIIFIIGVVSGYLGNNIKNRNNGNGHNSGA